MTKLNYKFYTVLELLCHETDNFGYRKNVEKMLKPNKWPYIHKLTLKDEKFKNKILFIE